MVRWSEMIFYNSTADQHKLATPVKVLNFKTSWHYR